MKRNININPSQLAPHCLIQLTHTSILEGACIKFWKQYGSSSFCFLSNTSHLSLISFSALYLNCSMLLEQRLKTFLQTSLTLAILSGDCIKLPYILTATPTEPGSCHIHSILFFQFVVTTSCANFHII